jgi:hypothetical protein
MLNIAKCYGVIDVLLIAEIMVYLSHLHSSTPKFDMNSCTLLLLTTDLVLLSLGNINIDRMMKESEGDVKMRQTISHILIGHLQSL